VETTAPVKGVEFVGGDVFDPSTFPSPCDIIFMKHMVFCELDDDDSMRALQSCHAALSDDSNGRLIVAEAVLPDCGHAPSDPVSIQMDAFMMLVGRPSAKTRREWSEAASQAGFRLLSVQQTHMPTCSILEFCKKL